MTNSLQALVDKNPDATGTGGFVNLLTVAQKLCELLVSGNNVREEGPSCIPQF